MALEYTFNIGNRTTRFVSAGSPPPIPVDPIQNRNSTSDRGIVHETADPPLQIHKTGDFDGDKNWERPKSPVRSSQRSPPGLSIKTVVSEPLPLLASHSDDESDMDMSSPTSPGSPQKIQTISDLHASSQPDLIVAQTLSPVLTSITFTDEPAVDDLNR